MLDAFVTFLPVAAVLTLTPGVATALVVRSAAQGGPRRAMFSCAGNSIGILAWGLCAAVGIATIVATSATAFTVVKLVGALVLVAMGVQALLKARHGGDAAELPAVAGKTDRAALRDGLITSISNPKLAVFFVALFPQFLPDGSPALPAALMMAGTIVAFDVVWFSILAIAVSRARQAFVEGPWQARFERLTGTVLVGLGVRLATARH